MGDLMLDYRRLAAWGAVGILVLLLLVVALGPVLARHREYNAEIERDAKILQRLTRLDASRERIEAAVKRYEDEQLASMVYSQGMPPEQIALDVQKRVTGILDKSGAEVKTVGAYSVNDEAFQGSGIRVTFTGSLESVASALHEIEAGRPLVVIEEMDIKPMMQGRFRGREQQEQVAQSVQVQLAVVAYTPRPQESEQ